MQTHSDPPVRAVPELFRLAVTGLASQLNLDAQSLIDGCAIEVDGRNFWLMQYGDDDVTGVTILSDIGAPPATPEAQIAMTTPLLEFHHSFPVAVHGYYGYVPQANRLVHCTRIALDEVDDGALAIATVIMKANDALQRVQKELDADAAHRAIAAVQSGVQGAAA